MEAAKAEVQLLQSQLAAASAGAWDAKAGRLWAAVGCGGGCGGGLLGGFGLHPSCARRGCQMLKKPEGSSFKGSQEVG